MSNEELVKQIQQGINQGENMEQLYLKNTGYIRMIVKKYAFNQDDKNDLMQEAYFGLYEAVQRYEDTAGVLFMSYAGFWIRQAIQRYIEINGRRIRLTADMNSKITRYKKVISAYEMQFGRKPTEYELCSCLRINNGELEIIKKAYLTEKIQSLNDFIPGSDDLLLEDSIQDPNIDIENDVVGGITESSLHKELWCIVKDNTLPEENQVIEARYKKDMTFDAIGQLIGKTRDMARQIEARGLRKLRKAKITWMLKERFEVNYATGYRTSFASWKNSGESAPERIAIRNLEAEQRFKYQL